MEANMETKPSNETSQIERRSFLRRLGAAALILGLPLRSRAWGQVSLAGQTARSSGGNPRKEGEMSERTVKSDEEWRRILTPEQYRVTRQKGTERAFTGKYHDFKGHGVYPCVCCSQDLFSSDTKFDSGTGWPSFWAPISEQAVQTKQDRTLFMVRTEALCSR